MSLLYGIALNDSDYNVYRTGMGPKGKRVVTWKCPIYDAWTNMLERCYSDKYKVRFPCYIGCSVSEEWLTFSQFREWVLTQDWEGKQLDKDLLLNGNKVYSPDNCVFIDGDLNKFLTEVKSNNSDLPIGVYRNGSKYSSKCNNPFTKSREYLGIFDTPEDAHNSWLKRKSEHAIILSETQKDNRVAKALIERYKGE